MHEGKVCLTHVNRDGNQMGETDDKSSPRGGEKEKHLKAVRLLHLEPPARNSSRDVFSSEETKNETLDILLKTPTRHLAAKNAVYKKIYLLRGHVTERQAEK